MKSTTTAHTARRAAAGKVIGSIGIVAAAAAVAGMGTFGSFSDSTEAMVAGVNNGTVSIDLAEAANHVVLPSVQGGWLPGDSSATPINLVNTGTSALASITLDSVATQSSVLDTDKTNGLQLTVDSCSQAWDVAGSAYSCAGTVGRFYAGPIIAKQTLPNTAASLNPGGVDYLLLSVALPQGAGAEFQGVTTTISGLFTGIQRAGAQR